MDGSRGRIAAYLRALPVRRTAVELFALGLAIGFYSAGSAPGARAAPALAMAGILVVAMAISASAIAATARIAATPPAPQLTAPQLQISRRLAPQRLALAAAFGAGLAAASGALLAETAQIIAPGMASLVSGMEGTLSADATPTSKGGVIYVIRTARATLRLARASGTVSWPRHRPLLQLHASEPSPEPREAGLELAAPRVGLIPDSDLYSVRGGPAHARAPRTAAFRARSSIRSIAIRSVERVSGKAAGLMKALLLGVRDEILPEETEAFKKAGCIHALSLSGQHLSIIGGIAALAAGFLAGKGRARTASAFLVVGFVWLAGPSPALLRSLLMLIASLAASARDRPQPGSAILALAFSAQLLADPVSARSLSFTLSYLAMAGLIVLGPRCAYLLSAKIPPVVEGPLSAGIAAVLCTAPLGIAQFGELALVGIPASAATGPLVEALMWWTIPAALVGALVPFGPLAEALSLPTTLLYDALMGTLRIAANAPRIQVAAAPGRAALILVVVAVGIYVYARPHVDHLRGGRRTSRL